MGSNADSSQDRPASIAAIVLLGAVAVAGFNIQPMYLGPLADHLEFTSEQPGLIAGAMIADGVLAGGVQATVLVYVHSVSARF